MPGLPTAVAAAIRPHARMIGLAALGGLAGGLADTGLSFALRQLLDAAPTAAAGAALAGVVSLVLGLALARAWARWLRRSAAESAGHAVVRDLRLRLFEQLLRLPVATVREHDVGRLLVRFVSDLSGVRRLVSRGLADGLADGTAVTVLLAGLLLLDWRLGAGVLAIAALEAAAIRTQGGSMRAFNGRVRGQRSRLAGLIQDDLSGIEAIKAFDRERKAVRRVRRRSDRLFTLLVREARLAARAEALAEAMHGLAAAYVVGAGGWLLLHGSVTSGTLVGCLFLFRHLAPSARRLVLANEAVQRGRVQAARIAELLDRTPEPAGAPRSGLPATSGAVVQAEQLDGRLDFVAAPGGITAILGPSGSGKSRLAAYLLGFEVPSSGRLLVGGRDVRAMAPVDLRRLVAWSAADAPLFGGSVSRNVRLGRPGSSGRAVARALAASGLDRVVARFPRRLAHRVGAGGRRLAAGERALTALARALLVRRPILLLDEPFAGLDPAAVDAAWRALELGRDGRTTLVLTADPSIASRADRVFPIGGAPATPGRPFRSPAKETP